MVSARCKMIVKEELKKLGLHFIITDPGVIEIMENLTQAVREKLRTDLLLSGIELIDDKKAVLIERIKNSVLEAIHYSDALPLRGFSDYLSEKLECNYSYLSDLFIEIQGTTIETFIISHKIERAKELLIYGQLSLTEIAWDLRYPSAAHFANQFKKITGLTPSHFKTLRFKKGNSMD
jgi:AraC-like DNA-binding protein